MRHFKKLRCVFGHDWLIGGGMSYKGFYTYPDGRRERWDHVWDACSRCGAVGTRRHRESLMPTADDIVRDHLDPEGGVK